MVDERIINSIMNEYEELRAIAANDRKSRIDTVNGEYPRIAEIEREIFRLGLENTNNIIKNPEKANEYNKNFKENLERLKNEKNFIISENHIDPSYEDYKYRCKNCSDTGYDANGKKCVCFKQKLINAAYSMSNIEELIKKQNFKTFSLDYYLKKTENDVISPYENMKKILDNCKRFCDNFENEEKGIVFYGPTGLGKTFLSCAVAKELMDKGNTVIYVRATKMFSIFEDYRFGRSTDKSLIDNMYTVDLLIIDDLGTEAPNKNNLSFLFDIINERIDKRKKCIINTNLQLSDITRLYSMRFTSRLYENFMMYKLYGEDIRIKKLKEIK